MSDTVMGWILGAVLVILIIVAIIGVVSHSCRRKDQSSTDIERSFHALGSVTSVKMVPESTQTRNTAVPSTTRVALKDQSSTEGLFSDLTSITVNSETTGSEASSSVTLVNMKPESTQTQDIGASRETLVALIPSILGPIPTGAMYLGEDGKKQPVHLNPELEYLAGNQVYSINNNDHHRPIKTRINDSGSHDHRLLTARASSIQGTMPVSRIFYHPYIDPSIKNVLRDVDITIVTELEPDEEWYDGIGKRI